MDTVFADMFGVPAAECNQLLRRAMREWEERHTTYSVVAAYGQKAS